MANSSEKSLKDKIVRFFSNWNRQLRESQLDEYEEGFIDPREIFWEKRAPTGLNYKKGIPDIYFVYLKKHVEIELKKDEEEQLSPRQIYFQTLFTQISEYWQIDNFDDFLNRFSELHDRLTKD